MAALDLEFTPLSKPYWDALAEGRLTFQRCPHCRNAWLPAREECPNCLRPGASWETASGRGKVVSWVVYHVAYHKAFEGRTPYNVAIVELEEGPRLVTNILDPAGVLAADRAVTLSIEQDHGMALARFRLA